MRHVRVKAVVVAVLAGAGMTAGVTVPGAVAAGGSGWTSSVTFTNQVASSAAGSGR